MHISVENNPKTTKSLLNLIEIRDLAAFFNIQI